MGNTDHLLRRFNSLKLLQGISEKRRALEFALLAGKYGESHRRYHVLDHIDFCLFIFDQFKGLAKNPDALEVAICYHDYFSDIGVPGRQNEERSALKIVELMRFWGCFEHDIYDTMSAVLATAHDHTPQTPDNRLMVDVDLAGLGAPWPMFLINSQNVREECAEVPEEKFREGNDKFLRRLLERTPLYYTPVIEALFGAQAKANLTRWLNRP